MATIQGQQTVGVEAATAVNPFELLPLDVVSKILGFNEPNRLLLYPLKPRCEDLRRLRSTCKLFFSLVSEARFLDWTFESAASMERFTSFLSRHPEVEWKRMDLKFTETFSWRLELTLPAVLLQSAETLELVRVTVYPFAYELGAFLGINFFDSLQTCSRLRRIGIQFIRYPCRVRPPTTALPALTTLSLFNVYMELDELQAWLSFLPSLQHLYVWPKDSRREYQGTASGVQLLKCRTLRTLEWHQEGFVDSRRLEIDAPHLRELLLTGMKAPVTISCPSLTSFIGEGPHFQSAVPMGSLTSLSLAEVRGAAIPPFLAAAPNLQRLSFTYTRYDVPAVQPLWSVCRSVVHLHLNLEAWRLVCSEKQESEMTSSNFESLERVTVELDEEERVSTLRECVRNLGIFSAVCNGLRQIDICNTTTFLNEGELRVAVESTSRKYPACYFVLRIRHEYGTAVLSVKAGTRVNWST